MVSWRNLAWPWLMCCLVIGQAQADAGSKNIDDADRQKLTEDEVAMPVAPKSENLVEFDVSAATTNHFFIDASTLSVSNDGVVRYVLVVRAAGGAVNTSFEGMRCASGEYRIYASGRGDGGWAKSRNDIWRPIENKPVNRHHAALSKELFCPDGMAVASADAARDALRRGRNLRSGY
jgi:hypothetical protein